MNFLKQLYLICILLFSIQISAQDSFVSKYEIPVNNKNYGYRVFIEGVYQRGNFMQTHEAMADVLDHKYNAFEYKVGVKTNGTQAWQKIYRYPTFGFGFYGADMGTEVLGNPRAVFGFISVPIGRWKKFHLDYDLGAGLAYDWNSYDSINNPYNFAIGAEKSVYFSLGLKSYLRISKRIDASLGVEFRHFSNGATHTPNLGLNLIGADIGLRYNFNPIKNYTKAIDENYQPPIRATYIEPVISEHIPRNEINIFYGPGFKTTDANNYSSPYYFTSTFAIEYMRKINLKRKLGIGLDFMYDQSLRERVTDRDYEFSDQFLLGAHASFDLDVARFSLYAALGAYLYKRDSNVLGAYYLRVGLKYNITKDDKLWAMVALKTQDGFIADWIEWGIGYRWHKYSKK